MRKKPQNYDIDLYEIIFNLWENKFKIFTITTAFLILGYIFFYISNKNYIAITNIKPISTFEDQKYKSYNNLVNKIFPKNELIDTKNIDTINKKANLIEIDNINKDLLLNLFISKIRTEKIIEEGIIKFNLINKDNFIDEKNYYQAVKRNAILIIDQITSPFEDEKDKRKNIPYWQFNFEISDKISWSNFLKHIEIKANEEIRQSFIDQFNTDMNNLNNHLKFQLEDINQNIKNALEDYKTSIANRLAFLNEQAEIARTLNIAKSTLEADLIKTYNNTAVVTNIKYADSYYLKGFEMIEKEISLINSRKNVKPFVSDLIELEKKKRNILQNKNIERLKYLFSDTPINNKDNFRAAKIDYTATTYRHEMLLLSEILVISFLIGLLMSFMYIFFNNLITSRE